MKLVVFGANGGVGQEVVTQALKAGHEVISVVRELKVTTEQPKGLHLVEGSVTDPTFIASITKGCDVVISTVGTAQYQQPVSLYSSAAKALIEGMKISGASRLIVLSAGGATIESNDPLIFRSIIKPILQWKFHYLYEDMLRMEHLLETADLDWTIMRLSYLVNKPLTGKYRTARNAAVRYGRSINRADLAHYIVNHLDDAGDYKQHVSIAN